MDLPRLSIVTISFNQAQYLPAAIESVLNQNYPNLQYIVVDPGSTDGSRDIINSYRRQIDVKIFEPDQGPGDGLRKGFAKADGEICGFLNSDDIFLPGALLKIGKMFVERPDVDLISGHCHVIDENGVKLRESYSDRFVPFAVLHRAAILMQPSTFFRRSAYLKTSGFDPTNRYDFDTDLWFDMHANGAKFLPATPCLADIAFTPVPSPRIREEDAFLSRTNTRASSSENGDGRGPGSIIRSVGAVLF